MAAQNATLVDILALVPHALIGLSVGIFRLATRPFADADDARPPTAFKDFVYAVLRYVLASSTVTQEKWMLPTTDHAYLTWARGKGLQPDTAVLASGSKLHWIGESSAQKVFLYFHGGGYVRPMSIAHLDWLLELQTDLSKTKNVAIAAISYTCAPEGQYPLQLRQGAESLLWLLETQGRKPEDIFIGGDSAGGNLALALLSHLLHPHPNLGDKLRIELPGPLAGAILTSPWVKFPMDDNSVKRNEGSDFICTEATNRWSTAFIGSAPFDNYNQPLLAPADWFSGLDELVKGVLVWGGQQEILIDSIDAIAQTLEASCPNTEYVRSQGGAHVGWLSHKLLMISGKEQSTQAIESWIATRL